MGFRFQDCKSGFAVATRIELLVLEYELGRKSRQGTRSVG